jgi:hypothetical protein
LGVVKGVKKLDVRLEDGKVVEYLITVHYKQAK